MARNPDIIRPVSLHTSIPEDLWTKMTLHLFSEVEGRVPKSAYREFISSLIREYFNKLEQPNA